MDKNSQDFTLLTGSKVIDGNGGRPIEDGVLLMEGDEIKAIGQKGSIPIPEGASINEIDYPGMTLLPGLVDCHVHLIGIGDGRSGDELSQLPDEVLTLQASQNAEAHLFSGVTTVRDLGAKNKTTFMLRLAQRMGITNTPRLILSGRPIAIFRDDCNWSRRRKSGSPPTSG